MRVRAGVDNFADAYSELEEDVASFVTAAMVEGTQLLKVDLGEIVQAAGLGNRLGKTWKSKVYPQGQNSLDPAGWVWTKAPVLIDAFDRGVTIRTRDGGAWLAIPTAAAGKRAPTRDAAPFGSRGPRQGARVTPGGFERRTGLKLRFIYQHNKPSLLVVDTAKRDALGRAARYQPKGRGSKLYGPAGQTIVVFILVRQVRLAKRYDIDSAADRAANRHPALLTKHWR
jgi:hypothetical protein